MLRHITHYYKLFYMACSSSKYDKASISDRVSAASFYP